jgi:hypothetical protein
MFLNLANAVVDKSDKLHGDKYYLFSWIVSTSSRPVFLLATIEEIVKTAFQFLHCFLSLALNIYTWFDHKESFSKATDALKEHVNKCLISVTGTLISPYLAHTCKESDIFSKIFSSFRAFFPNEYSYTLTFQFLGIKWLSLDIGREYKESLL